MSQISMQLVKELRDRTQAGLNDCKSALVETSGDMEKAVEVILKKGLAKSAKRAGAIASEGIVVLRSAQDGKSCVLVEVNIQTDFAARNEDFVKLANSVADVAAAAADGADLLAQPWPGGGTVEDARAQLVGKLGENITVRRWDRIAQPGAGRVQGYVHMGGKIAAIVGVALGDAGAADRPELASFLDDVAMHVAAMGPVALSKDDVSAEAKQQQYDIFKALLEEDPKAPPKERWEKVLEGKVAKWLKEVCLLEQTAVTNSEKTVDQLRADLATTLGTTVTITRYVRFERGEGIQKPAGDDFAAEVAKMAGA